MRLSFGRTSLVHNALDQCVRAVVFIQAWLVALQLGSLDLTCAIALALLTTCVVW